MDNSGIEETKPEFREEQMLRLVQKDVYLKFLFKDMNNKGDTPTKTLEILFNSHVIGDTIYTEQYEACAIGEATPQK